MTRVDIGVLMGKESRMELKEMEKRNGGSVEEIPEPVVLPEPPSQYNPLPEQMKRDNWQLFVLARSNDPSVIVPNTRKLVSNLVLSAKIRRDFRYNALIIDCIKKSSDAWYCYSNDGDKDWGYAVQLCEEVIDKIGQLCYDKEWSDPQKDSFVGSGAGSGKGGK